MDSIGSQRTSRREYGMSQTDDMRVATGRRQPQRGHRARSPRAAVLPRLACFVVMAAWPASRLLPADEITIPLTSEKLDKRLVRLVGPDVKHATRLTERGLLVTLPVKAADAAAKHGQVGVQSRLKVVGDFTITGAYELLSAEKPKQGYGVGVLLRVVRQSKPPVRAIVSRYHRRGPGQSYSADVASFDPQGKMRHDEKHFQTKAMSGRLRLERKGQTLRFLVADGDSPKFRELRRFWFEDSPIREISFVVDPGNSSSPVKARLVSLTIQSDDLPFRVPEEPESRSWLLWVAVGAVGVAGTVYAVRTRRRRGLQESDDSSAELDESGEALESWEPDDGDRLEDDLDA
jgi:hypothetical protein